MRNDIAALVGSRICHDLISPIGAIGNGVELIELTASTQGPEMALIRESVENANARIRFFRVAYGAGAELISILSAAAQSGRFKYHWRVDDDQSRHDVRIAFLLFQCFETAFPGGGDITVAVENDIWTFTASGDHMKVEDALWESLLKPKQGHDHSAAQVQFAPLPIALHEASRKLHIDTKDGQMIATIS
jgi:histidine phosphotransferase ChpT